MHLELSKLQYVMVPVSVRHVAIGESNQELAKRNLCIFASLAKMKITPPRQNIPTVFIRHFALALSRTKSPSALLSASRNHLPRRCCDDCAFM